MVKTHSTRSEMAKVTMNTFLAVRIDSLRDKMGVLAIVIS